MYSAKKCRFNVPESPVRRDTGPRIPSLYEKGLPPPVVVTKPRYEGEMAEREAAAQREIAFKKTCVAPMHKSNLVYVTPGMSPGSFRKNEVL